MRVGEAENLGTREANLPKISLQSETELQARSPLLYASDGLAVGPCRARTPTNVAK